MLIFNAVGLLLTYGIEAGADVTPSSVDLCPGYSTFVAEVKGKRLGSFRLNIPGRHNVQNALAAIAVGVELDLTADQLRDGLEHFRGADRRFQVKAEVNGITVIDDYGHHPAEIDATLEAARLFAGPEARIWAIFQPHRYTRTRALMDEFARSFGDCERVWVLDIYPASELPIHGITSEKLVERMWELGFRRGRYVASEQHLINEVLAEARSGATAAAKTTTPTNAKQRHPPITHLVARGTSGITA